MSLGFHQAADEDDERNNLTPELPPLWMTKPPPPMRARPSRFSAVPNPVETASPVPPPLARAPILENGVIFPPLPVAKEPEAPPPVPKFERIKESIYLCNKDLVRADKNLRKMDCDCNLPTDSEEPACGENCVNRATMVECSNRCKEQIPKYFDARLILTNGI